MKQSDTLLEALRGVTPRVPAPDQEHIDEFIEHMKSAAVSGETETIVHRPVPNTPPQLEPTQEMHDFLAPPEQPGELGRLGKCRIVKVLGQGGWAWSFRRKIPS